MVVGVGEDVRINGGGEKRRGKKARQSGTERKVLEII